MEFVPGSDQTVYAPILYVPSLETSYSVISLSSTLLVLALTHHWFRVNGYWVIN